MQKWEYLTRFIKLPNVRGQGAGSVFPTLGDALNEFGEQGWEVVSVWRSERNPAHYRAVFKRPRG